MLATSPRRQVEPCGEFQAPAWHTAVTAPASLGSRKPTNHKRAVVRRCEWRPLLKPESGPARALPGSRVKQRFYRGVRRSRLMCRLAFANSPLIALLPNPCAVVRFQSAPSSTANLAALVRRSQGAAWPALAVPHHREAELARQQIDSRCLFGMPARMGRSAIGRGARLLRGGPKQEIERLLGRQAVADLDFKALERAYYHCAQCQSGFCPRDGVLRLEWFSLTPGVLRMTAARYGW